MRALFFIGIVVFSAAGISLKGQTSEKETAPGKTLSDFQKGWHLDLGVYYPTLTTTLRVDSSAGLGTEVRFEDDLNMSENEAILEGMLTWNLGERWLLQADYIDLARTSTGVFDRDITWGDPPQDYQIGTVFGARFDATVARLSVGYRFFNKPNQSLAGTFGAHFTEAEAGIGAQLTVDGEIEFEEGSFAETGVPLPLPSFGLAYTRLMNQNLLLTARLEVFFIDIENWGGELYSGELNLKYLFGKRDQFGVGLGYKFFQLDIDYDLDDFNGYFQYNYHGPKAYLSMYW